MSTFQVFVKFLEDYNRYKAETFNIYLTFDVLFYINSIDNKKIYNKQSFMLILKFINFWIQETYESITHTFNNRIKGLRFLIIKFKDNRLYICDREIDFEKDCNTFLYNIINNNGHDYYNEEKNNIEYLIFIYINV